jgi:hypothetical protein
MFLRTRGEPQLTLGDFVDRAVSEHLHHIADELNDGQTFSPIHSLPQGSQLRKGV